MLGSTLDQLRHTLQTKCLKYEVPCLAVGIVQDNVRTYLLFGYRDLRRRVPVTPSTNFCIASVTKSFTALTVLKLQEKGKLSIRDQVVKYFPEYTNLEDVTIEDLLSHRSGIPALCYAEHSIAAAITGKVDTFSNPENVLSLLLQAEPIDRSRSRYLYLNEGYVLVGKIIEKVCNASYREVVSKLLLEPLKMSRTYFLDERFYRDPDHAVPYIKKGRKFVRRPLPVGIEADGGLISNLNDMLNYVEMLINRGVFEDREILSRDSIEEAEKPRVKIPYMVIGDDYYCLGLVRSRLQDCTIIHHSGSVLVHTSFMAYIPEKKIGVVVLESSNQYPPILVGVRVLAYLLKLSPESVLMLLVDEVLDRVTGTYYSYISKLYKVEVHRQGGFLILRDDTGRSTILVPYEISKDFIRAFTLTMDGRRIEAEFEIRDSEVRLMFERYLLIKQ